MSSIEIFVIIVGAIAGYFLVSHLLGSKPGAEGGGSNPGGRESGAEPTGQSFDGAVPWQIVLEVSRDASVDEIRRAYRTQMSKYHPDKVASLGKEFKPIAEQKSKQINAAYAEAMKDKGATP